MWNRSLSGLESRRSRKDDGESGQRQDRRFRVHDQPIRFQHARRQQQLVVFRCARGLTAALPLLWTQEVGQTVGDPLHLLHLRVLHPTKMEDPSVSWRNLTDKRAAAAAPTMLVNYATVYNCITLQIYTLSKDDTLKTVLWLTRQEEEQSGRTAGLRRRRKNSPRFL